MSNKELDEQKKERSKVIGGLVLGGIVFAWFLYYLLSHIPH